MVDIRPNALPDAILPLRTGDAVIVDQGADGVRQTNPISFTDSVAPVATQSEAQVGTDNTKRMTPLRTKQSIASEVGVSIASKTQGDKADSAVQSVNGETGSAIVLDKSDIGLGSVDNTSDADKPISNATQTALNAKANSSITISAGTGLDGGGSLAANRTLALNSTSIASLAKADSSVQTVNGVAPTGGNVDVAAEEIRLQNTRTAAIAESFAGSVQFVQTEGYSSVGDGGGGLYRRVSSEPTHTGKFQSADGTWWELVVITVNPKQFGAVGDGVTDDTVPMKNALDYMRNPSTTGLPGSIPRRNFRRKFDLLGRMYAVSETLDIDMCYGIHMTNGCLIATGTWAALTNPILTASNASGNNFDNFALTDLIFQCNNKCSGPTLVNSSLYQIDRVYVYGWGTISGGHGFRTDPVGWSASATINNMIVLPYVSWLDETDRTNYVGVGAQLGHNDVIITGCEIAAGYIAVRFRSGMAACQFNDNHTWIANPGQNPGVELNGNFGITLNGNYFDSHPVWIKGAGYFGISITNNFFLSGSPSPSAAVILESPSAGFALRDIVITGNTGSGGMSKVVERYTPVGTSFATTYRGVIIKDNPITTTANSGVINPTMTQGTLSTFIQTSALDSSFRTRVNIGQYLLSFDVPPTMFKASFGLTQNDLSMIDTYVSGYYWNQSTGYLHIKLNRSVPCFVTIDFDIGQTVPSITSVSL